MQAIMLGLTSVPGVMGGMLSDERGNILAHSFPPYFDAATIKGAAELLQDNTIGLQDVTGGVKLFDVRFELGRLIIKPLPHMFLVVLCQPAVNLQLLFISINVAVKKIENLPKDHLVAQPPPQTTAPLSPSLPIPHLVSAVPDRYRAVSNGKGVLLTCETMKNAESFFGVDAATINKTTTLAISDFFEIDSFKKLTITNLSNGIKKRVAVSVLPHDRERIYDGKISPSKSLFQSLKAKEGDQVVVEVVTGGGFFG
jgi:predicted regulator of Ras-like GTPase activity (Roadblock/LC7/MglB family)